jgi:excisionase family DNA binding protein
MAAGLQWETTEESMDSAERDPDGRGRWLSNDSLARSLRPPEWAAEFLRVTVDWVVDAAKRGEIPSLNLGTALRFDPVALKAWVEERSAARRGHRRVRPSGEVSELRRVVRRLATAGDSAISAEEAARRLGCGRTRVFELLQRGLLKRAKSFGRRTMLLAASVEALLSTGKKPEAPQPKPKPVSENPEPDILRLKL